VKNLPEGKEAPPPGRGEAARQLIRRTRQVTRRKFPAEEKIRILLEGIRGEVAVSELCRREGTCR
jgi:transposase